MGKSSHAFRGLRLLFVGSVVAVVGGSPAAAWPPVRVATDRNFYYPRQDIQVSVTALNPGAAPLALDFTSTLQASYGMDSSYDWKRGKAFLTVLTEVTIPPLGSHTWSFHHDWAEYAPGSGQHWVVGEVYGYGFSAPVGFTVVPGGDATCDGIVDVRDLAVLAWNYGQYDPAFNWTSGDITGDHWVDVRDLSILALNYRADPGNLPPDQTGRLDIPEPAMLSLLALGGLATLRRRRSA